jgi:hypothetical protein
MSDAIRTFSPCGTAVVWPFRRGMVVCLFDVECFVVEILFLEGFEVFLVASSLFGSWMALIFFFDFF